MHPITWIILSLLTKLYVWNIAYKEKSFGHIKWTKVYIDFHLEIEFISMSKKCLFFSKQNITKYYVTSILIQYQMLHHWLFQQNSQYTLYAITDMVNNSAMNIDKYFWWWKHWLSMLEINEHWSVNVCFILVDHL